MKLFSPGALIAQNFNKYSEGITIIFFVVTLDAKMMQQHQK